MISSEHQQRGKSSTRPVYEFAEFQVDVAKRVLRRRDGSLVPVAPRAFETLLYLVEHHGTVIEKDRLMEAIWPDTIVEENNLTQNISALRRVLGEERGAHRFIVTVPGRGYRFVAEVTGPDNNAAPVAKVESAIEPALVQKKAEAVAALEPSPATGMRRRPVVTFAVAAVVLLGLATLLFLRGRPPASAPALGLPEKSVAVLPFENLSDNKENSDFAAGIQDDVLNEPRADSRIESDQPDERDGLSKAWRAQYARDRPRARRGECARRKCPARGQSRAG